jgi:glycine dehydrogenase subunit 2
LLDKGFLAPTSYFPLLVPECLLIEPTETESKQTLDAFVAAMKEIVAEARANPELVKTAPHTTPVRRLDEVRAARELDLAWQPLR